MTNKRLVTGVLLATAALAFILTNVLGGPSFLGDVDDTIAISSATAAFVISWKQRSFLISGLLVAGGIIFLVPALVATKYLSVIVLPGPILGVISGLGILGLGIAKGIGSARRKLVTTS